MRQRDDLVTPHGRFGARQGAPAWSSLTRRRFVGFLAAGASLGLGCDFGLSGDSNGSARLTARPGVPTGSVSPGTIRLGSGDIHDGYLYVPASYHPDVPAPLVLALHGAGRNVSDPLALLAPYAEAQGFLLVAVNATDYSWDGVIDRYGADVRIIDTALERAFARVNVAVARVAVQGFSDGASYALGLGVANGDLFGRIIANSPGFLRESDTTRTGHPEVFISHGRQDGVLPIESTSRQLVPRLQADGYQVLYQEFDGGHTIPPDVMQAAVTWMLG